MRWTPSCWTELLHLRVEPAEAAAGVAVTRIHPLDSGESWTGIQRFEERRQSRIVAFRDDLDGTAVITVTHVPAEAARHGLVAHELAETDTLHTAVDNGLKALHRHAGHGAPTTATGTEKTFSIEPSRALKLSAMRS